MPKSAPKQAPAALLGHVLITNWLTNVISPATRKSRRDDLISFLEYFRIKNIKDLKELTRADIIDWRDSLIGTKDKPRYSIRTVKRRMSTISKFFEYLCDNKVLEINAVLGVHRPKLETTEGATQSISDKQAKDLLDAPDPNTLKGKRDRAILATFLYHAFRRAELCQVRIKDLQEREGIKQFRIFGKGSKERFVPAHQVALARISEYLSAAGHGHDKEAFLFKSVSNNTAAKTNKGLSPNAVYELVIAYGLKVGIQTGHFSTHSLRATAATNALNNREDIRKVQLWLGHANVSTTAMYDKRENRPEDSPTYRVRY